ncbi:MAG: hypothetical protein ACFFB5_14825 [Promethearchaeota archaeon]
MMSLPRSKEVKEKICKDFFPNCTYCTCYSMCFPTNETEDLSSQALLEQEKAFREAQLSSETLVGLKESTT